MVLLRYEKDSFIYYCDIHVWNGDDCDLPC